MYNSKQKMCLTKKNYNEDFTQHYCNQTDRLNSIPKSQRHIGIFKCLEKPVKIYQRILRDRLVNGINLEKLKVFTLQIFVIRSSVLANCHLQKVASFPSKETGGFLPQCVHLKELVSRFIRKTFSGLHSGQESGKSFIYI